MSLRNSSNSSLLIISFLLAISIVWIKGQERIENRTLFPVSVIVENQPENFVLPESWTPPSTSLVVRGPRNTIDLIRPDYSRFFVDLSQVEWPDDSESVDIVLTDKMFHPDIVDSRDRAQVSVVEEDIKPRVVSLFVLPWEITMEQPPYGHLPNEPDQLVIPLYRAEKRVPIQVPYLGKPRSGMQLLKIEIEPKEILVTGKREALDLIQSVSTTPPLDLQHFSLGRSYYKTIVPELDPRLAVRPVENSIQSVTVTVEISRIKP